MMGRMTAAIAWIALIGCICSAETMLDDPVSLIIAVMSAMAIAWIGRKEE